MNNECVPYVRNQVLDVFCHYYAYYLFLLKSKCVTDSESFHVATELRFVLFLHVVLRQADFLLQDYKRLIRMNGLHCLFLYRLKIDTFVSFVFYKRLWICYESSMMKSFFLMRHFCLYGRYFSYQQALFLFMSVPPHSSHCI